MTVSTVNAAETTGDNLLSVAKAATPSRKRTALSVPMQEAAQLKATASPFARPAARIAEPLKPVSKPQSRIGSPSGDLAVPAAEIAPDEAVTPVAPLQYLGLAYGQYKAEPNPTTFQEFMRVFKAFLGQPGIHKTPAATIIKANAQLSELGVRAIEAGSGRIWSFPRIPYAHEVIAQWHDTKATITFVGRRRKVKHVTYTTIARMQSLILAPNITLKEARVIGGEEGARYLVLVGEEGGSALWLHAFKAVDGTWTDSPHHFSSIPSFLTENVSGKVVFRGADLIFSVGRLGSTDADHTTALPEAESSTYRFWVKLTENGYVLQRHLPDLAQFTTVRRFLEALANNRNDIAKSLLADPKLLSIPHYVGVKGPSSTFHVAEMASPRGGIPRYRIITNQKNDLIFDVGKTKFIDLGKVKEKPVIKAIFIASPDSFLTEIAKILPSYDQLVPPPIAEPAETAATEAKHP